MRKARARACVTWVLRRSGAFIVYRTLISPYCSIRSALIQLFKNGTREYQETAPQRSRRLFMGTICLSTRARARAGVRVFTGRRPERRGAEPYEHRLYSLATTSNNLLPHSAGLSPARIAADTFLRPGKKPTRFSGYFISDFNA